MKKLGIVVSTQEDEAYIRIQRESACGGNCASCSSSCAKEAVVKALNKAGAETGDCVELELESSSALSAAFLAYVIPLVFLVAGYFAAGYILNSEIGGICAGFIFMAAAYTVISRAVKKNTNKYSLRVEKIINK